MKHQMIVPLTDSVRYRAPWPSLKINNIILGLGILLTRGNAALIISRTPDYVDASIDGDLDIDS